VNNTTSHEVNIALSQKVDINQIRFLKMKWTSSFIDSKNKSYWKIIMV